MEQIILMKGIIFSTIIEKFKGRNNPKKTEEQATQILLANDEVVTSIACGALHSLVLTSKNRLLSCGFGQGYALGHEDNQTLSEFKAIQAFNKSKSKTSPRSEKIEKMTCGTSHSCCLIEGRPYIWGMLGSRESLKFK